jgi:mannose/fructose/N-acetylgalactosamine-specific phosphotransferase system component IIC
MLPDLGLFVLFVILGGWVGLDSTSAGQFMVSRPVVAATVAGWLAGDPATGALLGLILEALTLTVLPVGAAHYPEMGPAALATAPVLVRGAAGPPELLTAVLFALSWAWIAGLSVRHLRKLNIRLMSADPIAAGSPARLERRHFAALGVDYLRGAALVAVGMPAFALFLALTTSAWGLDERITGIAVWSLAAAGIAAALHLFGERRSVLFVLGALCGVLFVALS